MLPFPAAWDVAVAAAATTTTTVPESAAHEDKQESRAQNESESEREKKKKQKRMESHRTNPGLKKNLSWRLIYPTVVSSIHPSIYRSIALFASTLLCAILVIDDDI